MTAILGWTCFMVLTVLTLLAIYQWILAVAALAPVRSRQGGAAAAEPGSLLVLIPAYNEEGGIASTLRSLDRAAYPRSRLSVVVVADRCTDRTAAIARACGAECLERLDGPPGKGAAIAWAVRQLRDRGTTFDGLVIVDADTIVDGAALCAFEERLRAGHEVQQGYNYLSNPWDSPFTRIIAVTSVLRNGLFYAGKERLGLSSMLSGTGMCFSRGVLERTGWNAFSVGEDWEFSVALLMNRERIHFNGNARVRAAESRGFRQASTQRLRWASGRHGVAAASTRTLIATGARLRRFELWDAAITMLAPTYSAQATLALLCLVGGWILSADPEWVFLLPWGILTTAALAGYFVLGLLRTDAPLRALAGVVLIPIFLPWRAAIELLGMLGCGRRRWVRTSRAVVTLLVASCCVAGVPAAYGQVLFEDDFESTPVNADGTIGAWDGPADPSVMYLTDRLANSGRRSLELKYVPGTFGASFMYRLFVGQDHVYFRWYQRWSPQFVWEPSATKMVILRPMGGYPQFYPEVLWANGQLAIQAQVIAEANWDSRNFYQNRGEPVVFEPGRWYCIEVFVKLNTPGAADGELAAWIDGEEKLAYTGREFRGANATDPAPSTAKIQAIGLSGYYGGVTPVPREQFSWQDDVVASLEPIGCRLMGDDFETAIANPDGTISGWDGPSAGATMYLTDGASASGARSLALAYAAGSRSAGYMYRHFPGQNQVYLRWYQRWSAGFLFEPSSTGLTGLRPYYGFPHFYPFVTGSGQLAIQAQVLADRAWGSENFLQNDGVASVFEAERWYCIEVMVKLNTPGVSDGAVAAWIDGEAKLSYTGRQFRGIGATDPSPSTARIGSLLVAGQYGGQTTVPQDQFSWQDDYVASTQRVGCRAPSPNVP